MLFVSENVEKWLRYHETSPSRMVILIGATARLLISAYQTDRKKGVQCAFPLTGLFSTTKSGP